MPAGDTDSFLETEYQERWEYVRHTETIRYRIVYWYFGLTGVLLGFTYLKLPDVKNPVLGLCPDKVAAVLLGFIVLYGIFTAIYLTNQKLNYRRQRERTDDIERSVLGADAAELTESDPSIWTGVFASYFYVVSVTVGGTLTLFLKSLGIGALHSSLAGLALFVLLGVQQGVRRILLESSLGGRCQITEMRLNQDSE